MKKDSLQSILEPDRSFCNLNYLNKLNQIKYFCNLQLPFTIILYYFPSWGGRGWYISCGLFRNRTGLFRNQTGLFGNRLRKHTRYQNGWKIQIPVIIPKNQVSSKNRTRVSVRKFSVSDKNLFFRKRHVTRRAFF